MSEILKFQQTPELLVASGDSYLKADCLDDAMDCYYRAVRTAEKDADEIMTKIARVYYLAGDYNQAVTWYIRAIHVNCRNGDAYPGIVKAFCNLGFDMRELATYYFNLGRRYGVCTEEEIEDLNELTEYCEQIEDPVDIRGRVTKSANSAMKYERGKSLLRENAMTAAYMLFSSVNAGDEHYTDARHMMLKIDFEREAYDRTAEIAEEMLEYDPEDNDALIYGAAAYGKIGDAGKRDELFSKVAVDDDVTCEALETAAGVAWSARRGKEAEKYLLAMYKVMPWDRNTLLYLALNYANLGDADTAHEFIVKVMRLYPDDLTVRYYALRIGAGEKDFEMLDTVPEAEAVKREDALDAWMTKLASLDAVTDGLMKDKVMSEYFSWLFQEGDVELQVDIASFIAGGEYWRDYLEQMLIDPDVHEDVKRNVLLEMFDGAVSFDIAVTIGQLYRRLHYEPPVELCPHALTVYRYSSVSLAFYCEGVTDVLNEVCIMLNERLGQMSECDDMTQIPAISAAVCALGNVSREDLDLDEYIDLFGCEEKDIKKYLKDSRINIEGLRRPNWPGYEKRRREEE